MLEIVNIEVNNKSSPTSSLRANSPLIEKYMTSAISNDM